MDHAIYCGVEHPELLGRAAIVRPHPERDDVLLAQFSDHTLVSPRLLEKREGIVPPHSGRLLWGYGWHELPVRDMPLAIPIPAVL